MAKYKINHLGVGFFGQNSVVDEEQLHALGGEDGIDLQRLLDLGAITETDEEPTIPMMEHDENQIYQTPTGDTVDYPGSDRPTVAAIAQQKGTKVLSPADRLRLFKGKSGAKETVTDNARGAARSVEAQQEQREKGLVPEFRESEVAEEPVDNHVQADEEILDENEPVPEPEAVEEAPDEEAVAEEEVPTAPPARRTSPQRRAAPRRSK